MRLSISLNMVKHFLDGGKKNPNCRTLGYSKTVPVVFEKNFLSVTLGSLRTL